MHDSNYCNHGTYVGGCGADHMCHWCEMGVSWDEFQAYLNSKIRSNTATLYLHAVFGKIADSLTAAPESMRHPVWGVVSAMSAHRR